MTLLLLLLLTLPFKLARFQSARSAPVTFTIDASAPVADGIFDIAAFEKYLQDRVKVEGRTNNLANSVTIVRGEDNISITVAPTVKFAKRYIKYLAKKFMKKHQTRDFLRIIAVDKTSYIIKYFNVAGDEEEDDE
eukprot:jgi/Hompol1/5198/HPOL_004226-RA